MNKLALHLYIAKTFVNLKLYKCIIALNINMDELNRRVCEIMDRFCGSKSIFANELGVGLPIITHITNGRNKPGIDILQKILLTYPTINATWLMIGKGEMITNEKAKLNIDNELNNIAELASKLNTFKTNTSQVISYHKLFMDELRHINELDSILLNTQSELDKTQQKIKEEIDVLKSKVKQ